MNKVSLIITTCLRDELLSKSVESILPYLNEDLQLIVVDQDPTLNKVEYFSNWHYISIPYNSGLSYARNIGVLKAKELGCKYVIIGSDSFLFNKSIKKIDNLIHNNLYGYDLLGFELSGCVCDWECYLKLVPEKYFELEFIEKDMSFSQQDNFKLFGCDIVRNFFLAKIDTLIDSPWNNELKLAEHEAFFYEYKQRGYKVGWTDLISANKMKDRPDNYSKLREENFRNGKENLQKIYKIKSWISYANQPTGVNK